MTGIWRMACCVLIVQTLWLGVPVETDEYIMVAVYGGLYIYPGDVDNITATTPSPEFTNMGMPNVDINSMDMNIAEGCIYFLDRTTQCIYRYSINTNGVTTVRCGVSRSVYSTIAYDWIGRNMYWTDGFFNWIAVQPVDTTDTSIYRVIIQDGTEKPRALAVDPIAGLLFWFDVSPFGYRIERASLDGRDRALVITQSLQSVHDIETDPLNMRIYWTDAIKNTIESSNYDGSGRKIVYKRADNLFRSLSIDTNYVCATTFDGQSWRCIHKSTGDIKLNRFTEFSPTFIPKLITVYKQDIKPPMTDDCPLLGCEHFCVKLSSISKCMCKEGYVMDSAGANCIVQNDLYGKGMFLCNSTNICMLDFRVAAGDTSPLLCLSNLVQDCRHLAVDVYTGTVFYADSVSNTINAYQLTTNVIGSLTSAVDVSGLTFDWTDGSLYWSEATSGQIKSLSLTNNQIEIISQSTSSPSLVTVDPHSRSLYWVEDTDGLAMRIMFKSLSNSSSGPLQTSLSSVKSLYHDVTTDSLFYIDNNILKTTTRNGSYITSFPFSMNNVIHMVIYKRYIFWDDGSGFLKSIPTQFFQQHVTSLPETFGPVTGVAVYDEAVQRPTVGLCRDMNGGCEHVCLTGSTGGVACACLYGFVLQPDQKSCSSVFQPDNFILAPDFASGIIYQVSTIDAHINALDVSMAKRPLSVVYEHTSSYIYWTEITLGQIIRASIDGTNEEVIYTAEGADSFPTFLALDSSTGNVYASITFGDQATNAGSIIVVHPSTKLVRTIVDDLQTVNGLALFPSKGIMFYVNKNSSDQFIVRTSMDGSNPRDIVTLPYDRYTTLTIDYITEKLYWSNQRDVSYSDLNGQNQTVLFNNVKDILAIQILENFLYYTSQNIHKIVKYDLVTGMEVPFMLDNAHMGIAYDTFIQPRPMQLETSECSVNNGGCSTFCLPREINNISLCACQDGIETMPGDPTLCENDHLCDDSVSNGIINNTCKHLFQEVCTFECYPGYRSTVATSTLTCMLDGHWNTNPQTVCENKCPADTVSDIWKLWASCQRTVNEACQYDCVSGYTKQFDVITCKAGNIWSHSLSELCVIGKGGALQRSEALEEDVSVAYLGVAVTGGLLLLVFFAILSACLIKRRRFKKQMQARQNPNGTMASNQTESPFGNDVAESGMFNDMRNFHSPLPPKEPFSENFDTMHSDPRTWDTLRDAVALDVPGESSDFDFGEAASFRDTNQPFSLRGQIPPISPHMNIIGQTESENNQKEEQKRKASESPKEKPKIQKDPPSTFTENDDQQDENMGQTPLILNAKPPMSRVSTAMAMKVPMEPNKSSERPPMRRTTTVASMQTVLEEPTMRRTNSALFPKSAAGASNRRRSSVLSSLGDQLNTRRLSAASLETKSFGNSQKRRASIACIPSQTKDKSMSRRPSSNSIQGLHGERQNMRRSSVVSVKMAFGEQPDNSRRSSVLQDSDEPTIRRSSIAPVETVEAEEVGVFE